MTLGEKIRKIEQKNPTTIVSLKNQYGIFWTGQARFVFGAVTTEAWNGTSVEVICKYEVWSGEK